MRTLVLSLLIAALVIPAAANAGPVRATARATGTAVVVTGKTAAKGTAVVARTGARGVACVATLFHRCGRRY